MADKNKKGMEKRDSLLLTREQRIEENRRFTLMSDIFLSVALADIPACQHVLRVLTGNPQLRLRKVKTQYTISKVHSRGARLDVLAEDDRGKLYIVEVQNRDTVDHARRTRFYSAMADSELLERGKPYRDLPELYVFYLTEADVWDGEQTVYEVTSLLGNTGMIHSDGKHVFYVNARVDDGSKIAKMMQYFRTADPEDGSQGALSKRVHFLKCEEGGIEIMCELSERIQKRGEMIGERRGEKRGERLAKQMTARNLSCMGMAVDQIAGAVGERTAVVAKWLAGEAGKN